jgi:flavin-dependent dehydrogenase
VHKQSSFEKVFAQELREDPSELQLDDGSRVAVVGGGPAGSFFTYFLLDMAGMLGKDIQVDIYEPRDYKCVGPRSCNMCGGIISESLVQILATEGINLPSTVVQRGIDSYVLHMDVGSVRIDTPRNEMRIGAVHRGAGPRGAGRMKWESFDGYLQSLALIKGANLIQERVSEISWNEGQPQVKTRGGKVENYDLLVVAIGVNSAAFKLFEKLDLPYKPPEATKTVIREYLLGEEAIAKYLGSSMHVFLLNIPRLEFAAVIPKGDYATVCLLGKDIDKELFETFLSSPEVKKCMPPGWHADEFACQCSPRMNIRAARYPFGDRIVFIGDCGVTRLYKDGIGGAYRTAKAAASTAIFQGIAAEDFGQKFWSACKTIDTDNSFGKVIYMVTRQIQRRRFARRAILNLTGNEQEKAGHLRRMSMVLWDMFTGSAPYKEIFMRTLHPAFWTKILWSLGASALRVDANVIEGDK